MTPCRTCAGSRQGERRVSAADRRHMHICRSPKNLGTQKWAVTASRSDGPAYASNNTGECQNLLCAADMMMAALH